MPPVRPHRIALVLSFLVAAGGTPDAAAQLGKLKKVLPKTTQASACVPDRPPTYVETLGLTAAQLMKINDGLQAEIETAAEATRAYEAQIAASEKEQKDYEKAYADYEKKKGKYDECASKVSQADAAKSEELNMKAEASSETMQAGIDQDKMQRLAEKASAAAERVANGTATAEDRKTMEEFQRMMSGVQTGSNAAIAAQQESSNFNQGQEARLEAACGKNPESPAPPAGAEPPGQKIREAGAKAAGMSPSAYAAGRDALIAAAMSNTEVRPGKGSPDGAASGNGSSAGPPPGKASPEEANAMNEAIKEGAKKICEMKKAGVPL